MVGVIENISWAGGVGDAFTVSCYMSQENAHKLAALKQTALKTTAISSFGFWIASYDQEAKKWYEEIHPLAPTKIMGQLSAPSKTDIRLHIGNEGVKVSPAVDVKVYNVYFEVVPAQPNREFHYRHIVIHDNGERLGSGGGDFAQIDLTR